MSINALNAKLNPICHLLALLGAHHILHVSRVKVKLCNICESLKCVFFPTVVLYGYVFGLEHRTTESANRALRKMLGER